jgi:hypothetical protein
VTRRGPFTAARSTVRLSETRKEASGRVPVSCGSSSRGTHTRDHALMAHPCEGAWPWCHLFASPSARCSHSPRVVSLEQPNGAHGHTERNHQGLGNQLIAPVPALSRQGGAVVCRDRLGRLLRYYYWEAAWRSAQFFNPTWVSVWRCARCSANFPHGPLSPGVWKSRHAIIHANYWRAQIEEENRWQRKISL